MPTPPAAAPPRASRRAALALCVVLAALLNLGGLGMAGQMAAADVPTAPRASPPPLRTRVVVLTPDPQPAATPAAPLQTSATATPAAPVPRRHATLPALAAPSPEGVRPVPQGDERPLRLYGFDEVDVAAEPEDDWAIDIAMLDEAGISRLVFELMVDERGSVIGCTVLDPTGLDDAVRQRLEQRIAATALRPAMRGGRFVASVRRIVLQVEDAV